MRVYDPVAGGEALVVIDVGSPGGVAGGLRGPGDGRAGSLVVVREGAHLSTRSRAARRWSYSRGIRAPCEALTVFEDPATGELRLASGSEDGSVRVWDLAAGGAALFVLEGHTR